MSARLLELVGELERALRASASSAKPFDKPFHELRVVVGGGFRCVDERRL